MLNSNESIHKKESTTEIRSQRSRLIPCADWPKFHAWPPIGGLRHLIFHAEANGFSKVIRRVGRRVLIDENEFFEFVNTQDDRGGKK